MSDVVQIVPLVLFAPVLALTIAGDLRWMRISNRLVIAGLALFGVAGWMLPADEIGARLIAAAVAFAICFVMFHFRALGGGDAKMMPVVLLFVPSEFLSHYLLVFAAAMTAGMIGMALSRRAFQSPEAAWISMRPGAGFPMGIAIGSSGLIFLFAWLILL